MEVLDMMWLLDICICCWYVTAGEVIGDFREVGEVDLGVCSCGDCCICFCFKLFWLFGESMWGDNFNKLFIVDLILLVFIVKLVIGLVLDLGMVDFLLEFRFFFVLFSLFVFMFCVFIDICCFLFFWDLKVTDVEVLLLVCLLGKDKECCFVLVLLKKLLFFEEYLIFIFFIGLLSFFLDILLNEFLLFFILVLVFSLFI